MKIANGAINCQACGAPVTSEICPYCGNVTGLNTATANMDYPVLECKEATFENFGMYLIFTLAFGLGGITALVIILQTGQARIMTLITLPFLAVGIGGVYMMVKTLWRHIMLKIYGEKISATVYGYMDDGWLINDHPAQIVKLLIQTPEGPRFIMYQLGSTKNPYTVNSRIQLKIYKNYFTIDKSSNYINWI